MSRSDDHAPDDLLALHATGDPLPDPTSRHVAECPLCTSRLAEFSRLVTNGRGTSRSDVPATPSPEVWAGITAELGLSAGTESSHSGAEIVAIGSARRSWTTSWLVAAVAAGVVAGAVLTTAGGLLTDDEQAPVAAPPVVAETTLAALPKKQGTGRAEIVETGQGKELVVDVSNLTSGDGFYEVWLIDPDTFQMVGLGALTNSEGRFPIPDGLDLSEYRVVDVSLEPLDGDPVHSRDSLVRGELDV
ncbi:MAG: anti-sigma factor [Actinomycetes bacterium]